MISEIVKWLGKREDRRAFDRRTERYAIMFVENGVETRAIGTDISSTGLSFVAKVKPQGKELNLTVLLRSRRINIRLAVRRIDAVPKAGETLYVVGGQFIGVAADDWDAIVRFVNGAEEPKNVAQDELSKKAGVADDAYRLLPLSVQQEIVRQLVRMRRLAPPVEGQHPLLRLQYLGNRSRADGTTQHRVTVHSRFRTDDNETLMYDTRFTLEDSGLVTVEQ
jgi:hypothetical protein